MALFIRCAHALALAAWAACAHAMFAQNYTVTVFAGAVGGQGFANGNLTEARFNHPRGVTMDSEGTVYVGEPLQGERIRKISIKDEVSTFAESIIVYDFVTDEENNLYAPELHGPLYKYSPSGSRVVFSSIIGTFKSGITRAASGDFYVTLRGQGGPIIKVSPQGQPVVVYGMGGDYLNGGPMGIVINNQGDFFVSLLKKEVRRTNSAWQHIATYPYTTYAIAAGRDGTVHIVDGETTIRHIKPDGTETSSTVTPIEAFGAYVDDIGNLYLCSEKHHVVFKLMTDEAINDSFALAARLKNVRVRAAPSALSSKQPGEPDHAGNPGGKSLWWTWTAPSDGVLQLDTRGSNFDTLLAVYTGAAVDGLAPVAANDNAPGTTRSAVAFAVGAGVTYQIAVDGAGGANGEVVLGTSFTPADSGPLANWQSTRFTPQQLADPAVSADTAAPAGDGIQNLVKYAFGLDPFVNATGRLPAPVYAGGALHLGFAAVRPDVQYTVEVSTDLVHWTTAGVTVTVSGAQVSASYDLAQSPTGRAYFRIVVAPAAVS